MKPTIGRIVWIHQPDGTILPAIVTMVHSETCISATGFLANGNVSPFLSISRRLEGEVAVNTCWDWPVIEAVAGEPLEVQTADLYGGINLLGLLGGDFGAIVGPLLVMMYTANRDRISTGADRIMTPPQSSIDYVLNRFKITDADAKARFANAVQEWGDKGGDVLTTLADIIAEK